MVILTKPDCLDDRIFKSTCNNSICRLGILLFHHRTDVLTVKTKIHLSAGTILNMVPPIEEAYGTHWLRFVPWQLPPPEESERT